MLIFLHFIPFLIKISAVPLVADKENPNFSNLCATPIISCLWESLTDKNAKPFVGNEFFYDMESNDYNKNWFVVGFERGFVFTRKENKYVF